MQGLYNILNVYASVLKNILILCIQKVFNAARLFCAKHTAGAKKHAAIARKAACF